MRLVIWQVAGLVLAALSLGPSFAHLLEAGPRMTRWSPELWREATVFNGQYQLFGLVGGPIDIGVILVTGVAAYLLRGEGVIFECTLAGLAFFMLSLICWLSIVAPANAVLATWTPGPLPEDFFAVRNRWESGHMIMSGLKTAGFVSVALAAAWPARGLK